MLQPDERDRACSGVGSFWARKETVPQIRAGVEPFPTNFMRSSVAESPGNNAAQVGGAGSMPRTHRPARRLGRWGGAPPAPHVTRKN
jgi:hypothetical protein